MNNTTTVTVWANRIGNVTAVGTVNLRVAKGEVDKFLRPSDAAKSNAIRVLLAASLNNPHHERISQ